MAVFTSLIIGGALMAAQAGMQAFGMNKKATAPPPAPKPVDEEKKMEDERIAERKRRQLIAQQNDLIKTSALGAQIDQNKLGGATLTGA